MTWSGFLDDPTRTAVWATLAEEQKAKVQVTRSEDEQRHRHHRQVKGFRSGSWKDKGADSGDAVVVSDSA